MLLLLVVRWNSVCRYWRGGVEAGDAAGQRHFVLALQPALEVGARLQQAQPHVHAGAAELLLQHGQVPLELLAAVAQREAGALALSLTSTSSVSVRVNSNPRTTLPIRPHQERERSSVGRK
jgi:hypothetical protein